MSDPVLLTDGPDTGLVSHMRNPIAEQRLMVDGGGSVELSNREVLAISGVDRLGWLHSLTSQFLDGMERGRTTTSLVLSPTGHVEHVLHGVDDGQFVGGHERRSGLLYGNLRSKQGQIERRDGTILRFSDVYHTTLKNIIRTLDGYLYTLGMCIARILEVVAPSFVEEYASECIRARCRGRREPSDGINGSRYSTPMLY